VTGAWIETNSPTLARVGRHHWQPWVPWVLVLGVTYLTAGLAAGVSRWRVGRLWGDPAWVFERSVWPHGAAMTLVVWLALAVAVPLLRARLFAVAVAVCAGAAFGPLRLVAAPIHGDLEFIESNPSPTQAGWPVVVASVLTFLLVVVARRLARVDPVVEVVRGALVGVAGLVCLALPLLALPVIPGATVDPGHQPGLSFVMVTGWGLLAGGLLAAGPLGVGGTSTARWRVLLAAASPATMWWAYQRDGGWPGVPGWDYGMQSPLFLTVQITAVLIGAAALGWALRSSGLGDRLRQRNDQPAPSTSLTAERVGYGRY
jgi:hypothetical protein